MRAVAIVNPVAGRGSAPRDWPLLLEALGPAGDSVETWWTHSPGEAEALAARARREGYERVLAVGGDGTLLEVANGLWWEPGGRLPILGVVPFGTGCDYVRNFRLPSRRIEVLAAALLQPPTMVGVGTCTFVPEDGASPRRAFLNAVGAGLDAKIVAVMNRRIIQRMGRFAYVAPALWQILTLDTYEFRGTLDDARIFAHGSIFVAALGRYFGGGMQVAPAAAPGADHLQTMWCETRGHRDILKLLPQVYLGCHIHEDCVRIRAAHRIELVTGPPAPVEADGEFLGHTPLSVKLHPRALPFAAVPK